MCTTMKTFENLQDIWNKQSISNHKKTAAELIKMAEEHSKKIKLNHIGTLVIIGITILILIPYFIWIGSYSFSFFTLGLALMIISMLTRIMIEGISIRKFNSVKTELPLLEYCEKATQFYHWRKKIHFIVTPIIYMVYLFGFSLLIPTFKTEFSTPFFIYLMASGYGFLIGFAFFLRKKIKNEMKILEFLKNIQ
jgi:hypothetical protein